MFRFSWKSTVVRFCSMRGDRPCRSSSFTGKALVRERDHRLRSSAPLHTSAPGHFGQDWRWTATPLPRVDVADNGVATDRVTALRVDQEVVHSADDDGEIGSVGPSVAVEGGPGEVFCRSGAVPLQQDPDAISAYLRAENLHASGHAGLPSCHSHTRRRPPPYPRGRSCRAAHLGGGLAFEIFFADSIALTRSVVLMTCLILLRALEVLTMPSQSCSQVSVLAQDFHHVAISQRVLQWNDANVDFRADALRCRRWVWTA